MGEGKKDPDSRQGDGEASLDEVLLQNPADRQKTITMATISKASGISQGAVSSMLNGRNYGIRVRKETRDRVFRVCRELGYIPNDLRAIVRMYPEVGELCILHSKHGSEIPFFRSFVAHVMTAAHEATADCTGSVTLSCYHPDIDYRKTPAKLPRPIRSGMATKFLLFGELNAPLEKMLLAENSAVVALCSDPANREVATVRPDFAEASSLALRHLRELGHKRIAVLTGPKDIHHPACAAMDIGLEAASAEVAKDGCRVEVVRGNLSFASGAAFVDTLVGKKRRPTAVFCFGDGAAAGVLSRANEVGLHVPDDLSVAGCSHDSFPEMLSPRLTSVRLPVQDMAEQAVHTVEKMVTDPSFPRPARTILPLSLVERRSCARPRS